MAKQVSADPDPLVSIGLLWPPRSAWCRVPLQTGIAPSSQDWSLFQGVSSAIGQMGSGPLYTGFGAGGAFAKHSKMG